MTTSEETLWIAVVEDSDEERIAAVTRSSKVMDLFQSPRADSNAIGALLEATYQHGREEEEKFGGPYHSPSELERYRAARCLRRSARMPADGVYLSAEDLRERLGISRSGAYQLLRRVGLV